MSYLKSNQVKVYPTAHRTEDPASRLATEFNITNQINQLICTDSFIIHPAPGTLIENTTNIDWEFNIGGYYFKLSNYTGIPLKYAYIKTANRASGGVYDDISLVDCESGSTTEELDVLPSGGTEKSFVGLGFSASIPTGTDIIYLQLLDDDKKTPYSSYLKFKSVDIQNSTGKSIKDEFTTGNINGCELVEKPNGFTLTGGNINEGTTVGANHKIDIIADTTISAATNITGATTISNPIEIKANNTTGLEIDSKVGNGKSFIFKDNVTVDATSITLNSSNNKISIAGGKSATINDNLTINKPLTISNGSVTIKGNNSTLTLSSGDLHLPVNSTSVNVALVQNSIGASSWKKFTNSNEANTIVMRDGSGNFSAGIITADITIPVKGVLKLSDSSNSGEEAKLAVGDDAYIHDIDTASCIGIYGQSTTGNGGIVFGKNTSSGKLLFNGSKFVFGSQVEAPTFNAPSDRRLKENIIPFDYTKSILNLPIYEYDYKKDGLHTIGCMAQDLQEICPQIINEDKEGYLSISESKLIYLLLEEVKKLNKKVEELERR